MHDNAEVPFTEKSELLLFTSFFSGIPNVFILLGFGVRFWLFVGFDAVVVWLDLFVWGFLFCFCLNITPVCTSKPQAAVAAGVRQKYRPQLEVPEISGFF